MYPARWGRLPARGESSLAKAEADALATRRTGIMTPAPREIGLA